MVTPDGRGHRFVRGEILIDVLAADNLGDRVDLTTIPPARTIEVPGGSQALRRTELVDVSLAKQVGRLARPSMLGAILLKARAVDVDPDPERHLADLALLLSLADDPFELVEELTRKEQRYVGARQALLDPNHRHGVRCRMRGAVWLLSQCWQVASAFPELFASANGTGSPRGSSGP